VPDKVQVELGFVHSVHSPLVQPFAWFFWEFIPFAEEEKKVTKKRAWETPPKPFKKNTFETLTFIFFLNDVRVIRA
jgi:hypothetical protein